MTPTDLQAILAKTSNTETERRVLNCNRPRVYVAGAMSADKPLLFLENLSKGMRIATELLQEGYAPYSPFFDFHYSLVQRLDSGERVRLQDYYEASAVYIDACHVLYIEAPSTPGGTHWQDSIGTINEIKRAQAHHVPVVIGDRDLLRFICPLSDAGRVTAMKRITLRNKRVESWNGICTLG